MGANPLPANLLVTPLALGTMLLDQSTGHLAFCSGTSSIMSSPPRPLGKCGSAGSVGTSTAGYIMTPVQNNAIIVNKQNGNIYECVNTVLAPAGLPDNQTIYSQCSLIGLTTAY